MSEPFLERLSRFTPDAGALDRDTLLYAAGRASARPNRAWITLAAVLAVTQALSLVLLWPRPAPPVVQQPPPVAQPPSPPEPPNSDSPDNPDIWSVGPGRLGSASEDRLPSAPGVTIMDSGPPLRAFGPPPPSVLN